jgi:hypothetical protein
MSVVGPYAPPRPAANGRLLPVATTGCAGQFECKRLESTDAIDWVVDVHNGDQVHAIAHT